MLPGALLSRTIGTAANAVAIAIGTLTPRHQRQDAYSVSTPPRIRPMAAPPPAIAPNTPNARARSFGSVKVTVISDSAAGASSAPNAALQRRGRRTAAPPLAARPPSADAPAKPSRPMMKVRLRPQ